MEWVADESTGELRRRIATNTSIKLAGGVSERDARSIAPDMRTTPTFILAQQKHQRGTQFACYIRNHSAGALSLGFPFGSLESQPMMGEAAHRSLLARNQSRISMSSEPIAQLSKPDLPWKLEPQRQDTQTVIQPAPSSDQNDDNWES